MKRKAVGIWNCNSCHKSIAGGAWTLTTTAAATVRRCVRVISQLGICPDFIQHRSPSARHYGGIDCCHIVPPSLHALLHCSLLSKPDQCPYARHASASPVYTIISQTPSGTVTSGKLIRVNVALTFEGFACPYLDLTCAFAKDRHLFDWADGAGLLLLDFCYSHRNCSHFTFRTSKKPGNYTGLSPETTNC